MLVILVVLIVACIVLYFLGKRAEKKQAEQQQQLDAVAQTMSMLIIDKKKMKLKDAGFPQIVINNSNQNQQVMNAVGIPGGKAKNKWVSLLLCLFLGFFGGHKFYEEKIGTGILYLFTGGLFGIGVIVNFFQLLNKSNPYYV